MRFSIRDGLWATAIIALVATGVINSRKQASHAQLLEHRTQVAEDRSAALEQMVAQQRLMHLQAVARARKTNRDQAQELLTLRQLLKQSIHDQRDWFALQVAGNRIVAMGPATTDSPRVTAHTVRYAEAATGLNGKRLRHFMVPIQGLRPSTQAAHTDE